MGIIWTPDRASKLGFGQTAASNAQTGAPASADAQVVMADFSPVQSGSHWLVKEASAFLFFGGTISSDPRSSVGLMFGIVLCPPSTPGQVISPDSGASTPLPIPTLRTIMSGWVRVEETWDTTYNQTDFFGIAHAKDIIVPSQWFLRTFVYGPSYGGIFNQLSLGMNIVYAIEKDC